MQWNAGKIAEWVQGTVEGDASVTVHRVGSLNKALPGAISFYYDPKYLPHLFTTQASVILVAQDLKIEQPVNATLIRVAHPYRAFNTILQYLYKETLPTPRIEEPCFISSEAVIGQNVYIGCNTYIAKGVNISDGAKIFPNCYIGNDVIIGANTVIYPNVTIYAGSIIGTNCILHAGVVVGSDGFGFLKDETGTNIKIPQLGRVIIEDEVEIGANTTIDRSTLDDTVIHRGVKLDNLVQIAHNTEVGEQTVIASQAGLSGGTIIGKNCMIGGQVGFVGHLEVADGTQLGGQSGVTKSITEKGKAFRGSPATEIRQQLKLEAMIRKLPELLHRIESLENLVQQLQNPAKTT